MEFSMKSLLFLGVGLLTSAWGTNESSLVILGGACVLMVIGDHLFNGNEPITTGQKSTIEMKGNVVVYKCVGVFEPPASWSKPDISWLMEEEPTPEQ